MAAVFGPLAEIERIVDEVDGNVVIANINSSSQAVIGGATDAVERAIDVVQRGRDQRRPDPGEPRLPHLDRGPGPEPARRGAAPAGPARARGCPSSPT